MKIQQGKLLGKINVDKNLRNIDESAFGMYSLEICTFNMILCPSLFFFLFGKKLQGYVCDKKREKKRTHSKLSITL